MTFDRHSAERTDPIDTTGAHTLVVVGEQHAVEGARLVRVPYSYETDGTYGTNGTNGTYETQGEPIFLGRDNGTPLFVNAQTAAANYTLLDYRTALATLSPEEVSLLAYARGMLQWAARTRFCSVCGTALETRRGGHMRFCPGCHAEHYPRLDPAVMMLVTHDDRLLLARHQGRGAKFWSTLAGFVEPGETLEQAAARELHEETGLVATSLRYYGSQPWPLPASLMIGFEIEAENDRLTIDETELTEARWFAREELAEITTSGTISLSGQMIASWRAR